MVLKLFFKGVLRLVSYEEEWIPIDGFPKYSVNSLGQVRHNRTERLVQPILNQFGVAYVGLVRDYSQKKRSLALLVARTFIPLPPDLENFDTPINLDGDRFNCSIDNLMWRPRWFAIQFHQQFKLWPVSYVEAPIKQLSDGKVFRDSREVAKAYGLLEIDLFVSIQNRTYVWPTYQQFDLAE